MCACTGFSWLAPGSPGEAELAGLPLVNDGGVITPVATPTAPAPAAMTATLATIAVTGLAGARKPARCARAPLTASLTSNRKRRMRESASEGNQTTEGR